MAILTVIDWDRPGESRTHAIARRLRGELAQLGITGSEAARRIGFTQAYMSRRLTGRIPFKTDDLDRICTVLDISFDYIATGSRTLQPVPPDGGPASAPRETRTPDLRIISQSVYPVSSVRRQLAAA